MGAALRNPSSTRQIRLPVITDAPADAPTVRSECIDGPRPCQWVSCRYHLWEVSIRPGRRWYRDQTPASRVRAHSGESCALDLAEIGGMDRPHVARVLGMTRERVRQIETQAIERMALATSLAEHQQHTCRPDCAWCDEGSTPHNAPERSPQGQATRAQSGVTVRRGQKSLL